MDQRGRMTGQDKADAIKKSCDDAPKIDGYTPRMATLACLAHDETRVVLRHTYLADISHELRVRASWDDDEVSKALVKTADLLDWICEQEETDG